MIYLNEAWYKSYRSTHFHFFDDSGEWLQADKVGHAYTGYQGTRLLTDLYTWSGSRPARAPIYAAATAFGYLTAIECLDGFSNGWGFSWSDMASNFAGVSLAVLQQHHWGDQRLHLKFNYTPTALAALNPELLGEHTYTRLLKDYNGHVYWLSFNPFVLAGKTERGYLPWLNLSVGYGAYGMLGARVNPTPGPGEYSGPAISRIREYYLSIDLDFSRIKTRWKSLNSLLRALNVVKIPAPALKFSENGSFFLIR